MTRTASARIRQAARPILRKVDAHRRRMAELHATAQAIVSTGVCPTCGAALRRNLALAGWWQCSQLGAEGFRADASKPSCNFQTFTE